ncbi:MAG: Alpha-monoglucosyldiacylglycerol synthase [Candidatus Omnitrophica bacterium]|nr:Alpha-monoglucosyldiacylglycerol synthase [Candidatus Omnitrophota bacterium]
MNILMMTNTYKPIIGGLEKSVESFTGEYRRAGHRVVIVAPEYDGAPEESGVVRVPALQDFNGSDFSVQLPVPGVLSAALKGFAPDIVHAHHPFLIGDTALRLAYARSVPLVFTHHSLYEHNTHYVPGDSAALKRFVVELSTGYANVAHQVIAPSGSVRDLLLERGVETPIEVVPTGIDLEPYASGQRERWRRFWGIPKDGYVIGHVGRLAPEKNLELLSAAAARHLSADPESYLLLVGEGPSRARLEQYFTERGVRERVFFTGLQRGQELVDAYSAMDAFLFVSQSETQGLVLAEALACGVPLIAVDACGVRDAVRDGHNGYLVGRQDEALIADAILRHRRLSAERRSEMRQIAVQDAERYSMPQCAARALGVYERLIEEHAFSRKDDNLWTAARGRIKAEWRILKNLTKATTGAVIKKGAPGAA